jgi:hypothetical protein
MPIIAFRIPNSQSRLSNYIIWAISNKAKNTKMEETYSTVNAFCV